MKKIKPSIAFIYELLFATPICVISVIAFVVGIQASDVWIIIGYGLLLCASLGFMTCSLYNIQWIKIDGARLIVYSIFGRVKEYDLTNTKRAFLVDVMAFSLKGIRKTTPCLVLTTRKSFRASGVEHAFNRKKHPYVIVPYTAENLITLEELYMNATGNELEVKMK